MYKLLPLRNRLDSRQRYQAGSVFGRPTYSARQTVESPLLWPWARIPNMSSDKQSAQIRSGTTADYGLGVVVWGNRAWASGGRAGASCT